MEQLGGSLGAQWGHHVARASQVCILILPFPNSKLITNKIKATILGMTGNKMGNKGCCTSLQKNKITNLGGTSNKI